MITASLCAACLACIAIQSPVTSRIHGTVRDVQGYPIPGATVTIAGERTRAEVVSDEGGAFRFANVPAGSYSVRITMAGFRPQVAGVLVRGDRPVPPVNITLAVAPLASILWVIPVKPVAQADVIAHIRIVRTAPPARCEQAVTTFHEAEVVVPMKGSPEARVTLAQEGAGVCTDDDGRQHEGIERPYRAAEEYIVFLRHDAERYGRLAGPSLTFPVVDGRVTTSGFAGLPGQVSVAAFSDAVRKLI